MRERKKTEIKLEGYAHFLENPEDEVSVTSSLTRFVFYSIDIFFSFCFLVSIWFPGEENHKTDKQIYNYAFSSIFCLVP